MDDFSPPWARFDDLVAGSSVVFSRIDRVLVADRPSDVPGLLDEVDRGTAAGRWAFGHVSYEAAAGLDPSLRTHDPVEGLPAAWFAIARAPNAGTALEPAPTPGDPRPWSLDWSPSRHAAAVDRVRARIAAGETYQCNVTARLSADAPHDLTGMYRDLALGQRGAHNAYLDTGRFVVAAASPELFFETRGDAITMRPMKGTAARGRTVDEDADAVDRLRGSTKERAENVMIVDLVRNDLSRVAVPGSVSVPRLLRPERYETVHQLTSDVTARLADGVGLTDLFRALFPCGSVTGAPKIRTMELIREIEDGPRGVYCGAVGVVAPPGQLFRARFSVAIRTVVVDRVRGTAVYGAGGGVTWSSRPEDEYAELLTKAGVLDARPRRFTLLETMRHDAGRGIHQLDGHLARLASSAEYFGFRLDRRAVEHALADAVRCRADARVRLSCSRDGGTTVEVTALPEGSAAPVRLELDPVPLESRTCWSRRKTSLRQPYDERLARHPDADDVVIVNDRGEVTETCTANLAVLVDGQWCTPPLSSGCLPGVERARLVADGRLRERRLVPADLEGRSSGLALVSSLRGWRPGVLVTPSRQNGPRAGAAEVPA